MATSIVRFEHVWKKFRRGERHDSLRDLVPALLRRLHPARPASELRRDEFWAIKDVSFEVGPGEALGIIGPNGAGKSTILKLLTRILRPTDGLAEVRGRVGALIEVAAGFHPDLTGRENVYLQGSIMGMKRQEIARKFDEIVAFAGVADFIDTPVKRYSSGMNARLGFAIAAHLDPDVLLIDEVLSVGDAAFQDRCVERMRKLLGSGIPVVFISHNLPAVIDLCTRAIVIKNGAIQFDGEPGAAVQSYRHLQDQQTAPNEARGPISIKWVSLVDHRGEACSTWRTLGDAIVRIEYQASEAVADPVFAVDIHRSDGVYCAGINSKMDHLSLGTLRGNGHVDLRLSNVPLLPGCYVVSVGILDSTCSTPYEVRHRAYPFSVISDHRYFGIAHVDHSGQHVAATHVQGFEADCIGASASLVTYR